MKVLFLGYGHMGGALGEAWKRSGLAAQVLAVDPASTSDQPDRYPSVDALVAAGAGEGIALIVLAVKPAKALDALRALPPKVLAGAAVVSIAAGVPIAALSSALPSGTPVVRAMPNTPVILNAGCTGLFAGATVDAALRASVDRLFATVGSAHWVDAEPLLDAVTALSGSGPAYYHLFSEALAAAGVALGLDAALARKLAADTAWGAAALQHAPGADFAALRQAVTSPNGTTAAAIAVFEEEGALRRLIERAALAARDRAVELSAS
ncbi:pyrroline-5-carboxylate reductase [Variovorax boronicumulans]|uniref:pyrroline-5-carboxylate reductase n=1 Tax=Variovorax boronicumulans TaxID=436515 RepID=UPI001C584E57